MNSEDQNKRHDKFESYIGVKLEEDESLHYGVISRVFFQLDPVCCKKLQKIVPEQ